MQINGVGKLDFGPANKDSLPFYRCSYEGDDALAAVLMLELLEHDIRAFDGVAYECGTYDRSTYGGWLSVCQRLTGAEKSATLGPSLRRIPEYLGSAIETMCNSVDSVEYRWGSDCPPRTLKLTLVARNAAVQHPGRWLGSIVGILSAWKNEDYYKSLGQIESGGS